MWKVLFLVAGFVFKLLRKFWYFAWIFMHFTLLKAFMLCKRPCVESVQDLSFRLWIQTRALTTSWGCWKHPFGIPGVRPMFLKPKLHKESKNGFKTINYRPPSTTFFFKKLFLEQKNHQKSWTFCWFLNFYGNIYG